MAWKRRRKRNRDVGARALFRSSAEGGWRFSCSRQRKGGGGGGTLIRCLSYYCVVIPIFLQRKLYIPTIVLTVDLVKVIKRVISHNFLCKCVWESESVWPCMQKEGWPISVLLEKENLFPTWRILITIVVVRKGNRLWAVSGRIGGGGGATKRPGKKGFFSPSLFFRENGLFWGGWGVGGKKKLNLRKKSVELKSEKREKVPPPTSQKKKKKVKMWSQAKATAEKKKRAIFGLRVDIYHPKEEEEGRRNFHILHAALWHEFFVGGGLKAQSSLSPISRPSWE